MADEAEQRTQRGTATTGDEGRDAMPGGVAEDDPRRKDLETKLRWAEEALHNRKEILRSMHRTTSTSTRIGQSRPGGSPGGAPG